MAKLNEFDVCIIGAGVAGGVMAAYLGNHGCKVAVIEKHMGEQERMIGELLQPGGVIKLKELGLEHLLDDLDAQDIEGYGLFMKGDCFKIAYPEDANGVITGRGLRNGKFVQRIRRYILGLTTVKVFEGTVQCLMEHDGRVSGVQYITKHGKEPEAVNASLTIVCDGMFSAFREQLSANQKKVTSHFLGMILKDCELPFKNHGHVIIGQPSTCLIYPISSSETRILIDFPGEIAPRRGEVLHAYLTETIAPQLPRQILPSFLEAVIQGKFKSMPNHLIPARPFKKAGVVMIGDSLNMRHPLTGGGMTAAFSDILSLGTSLVNAQVFCDSQLLDTALATFYQRRHKQNATINILADALYGVMQNEDLSVACYQYLKSGGKHAQEPIAILSAVSRDEQLLLRHFFAVAFYGVGGLLKPYPNKSRLVRSYNMLKNAVQIVHPLVINEKPNILTRSAFKLASSIF